MSVAISVDPDDPTPPYEQLRRQFTRLIASGALTPGSRLSPVRRLAGDLDLAAGTVARAYRELEAGGLVETRRGGGTIVLEQAPEATETARRERLAELARAYVLEARALHLPDDDAVDAVRRAAHDPPGSGVPPPRS